MIRGALPLVVICCTLPAAQAQPIVEPESAWSAVFGDQEAEFRYVVKSDQAFQGRIDWTLAIGPTRKLLLPGSKFAVEAGKTAQVRLRVRPPPVKDGVVLKAKLLAGVFADGKDRPAVNHEQALWIYPRNPFANRQVWLKGLEITLFDPEQKTAAVLKELQVPFNETANVAALADRKQGLLLVGEGTSFVEYRDLSTALNRAAANGARVLCLAPANGKLTLPGDGENLRRPTSLTWWTADHLGDLDARLAAPWPAAAVRASLVLKAEDGQVAAVVEKGDAGWPWFEARYGSQRGHLVFCGFALIEQWNAGPAPRFLFARILEEIDPSQREKELPP